MWWFSSMLVADGSIRWDVTDATTRNPKEGMAISILLARYDTLIQALDEKNKRLAVERLQEGIEVCNISWLDPRGQIWILDLDLFKDYINEPDLNLFRKTWFTGKASVKPEFSTDEYRLGGIYYETHVEFMVLPESNLHPMFSSLVKDSKLAEILTRRWFESKTAFEAKAYLSTIILLGSILEGVLLDVMKQHPKEANSAKSAPKAQATGSVQQFKDWSLESLITVTHECGWVGKDVHDFSKVLRDYRNLIHPGEQLKQNIYPDIGTCKLSFAVIEAVLDDLIH